MKGQGRAKTQSLVRWMRQEREKREKPGKISRGVKEEEGRRRVRPKEDVQIKGMGGEVEGRSREGRE